MTVLVTVSAEQRTPFMQTWTTTAEVAKRGVPSDHATVAFGAAMRKPDGEPTRSQAPAFGGDPFCPRLYWQLTVCAAAFLPALSTAQAANSLCLAKEETVYSCPSGSKLIAVCGSKNWGAAKGYLQYRFGTPRRIELTVPAEQTVPSEAALMGTAMISGGTREYMVFQNGEFRYVVYSAMSPDIGTIGGVVVQQGAVNISVHRCNRNNTGEFSRDLSDIVGMRKDSPDQIQLP